MSELRYVVRHNPSQYAFTVYRLEDDGPHCWADAVRSVHYDNGLYGEYPHNFWPDRVMCALGYIFKRPLTPHEAFLQAERVKDEIERNDAICEEFT